MMSVQHETPGFKVVFKTEQPVLSSVYQEDALRLNKAYTNWAATKFHFFNNGDLQLFQQNFFGVFVEKFTLNILEVSIEKINLPEDDDPLVSQHVALKFECHDKLNAKSRFRVIFSLDSQDLVNQFLTAVAAASKTNNIPTVRSVIDESFKNIKPTADDQTNYVFRLPLSIMKSSIQRKVDRAEKRTLVEVIKSRFYLPLNIVLSKSDCFSSP